MRQGVQHFTARVRGDVHRHPIMSNIVRHCQRGTAGRVNATGYYFFFVYISQAMRPTDQDLETGWHIDQLVKNEANEGSISQQPIITQQTD